MFVLLTSILTVLGMIGLFFLGGVAYGIFWTERKICRKHDVKPENQDSWIIGVCAVAMGLALLFTFCFVKLTSQDYTQTASPVLIKGHTYYVLWDTPSTYGLKRVVMIKDIYSNAVENTFLIIKLNESPPKPYFRYVGEQSGSLLLEKVTYE